MDGCFKSRQVVGEKRGFVFIYLPPTPFNAKLFLMSFKTTLELLETNNFLSVLALSPQMKAQQMSPVMLRGDNLHFSYF